MAATAIVTLWGCGRFAGCAIRQAMVVEAARTAPDLASTSNISSLNIGDVIGAGLAAVLSAGSGLPSIPMSAAGMAKAAIMAAISTATPRVSNAGSGWLSMDG